MTTFGGITVVVIPDSPKMQLSPRVSWLPEEFKAEMNAWMAKFFGMSNIILDGQAFEVCGTVYVNPRGLADLQREANKK